MNKKLILTGLLIAALCCACKKEQKETPMEEKQISLQERQVRVNYLQQGMGETTLLFLHGWCINSSYWDSQVAHFAKNYAVYALDLPGFGQSTSTREDWSIEAYAKDVSAFIDALDLQRVVLVGHSMSGGIILQMALDKHPQIVGLVGVDNFKFVDVAFSEEDMAQFQSLLEMLQNDFPTSAVFYAENLLMTPNTPQAVAERVKKDFAAADPQIAMNTFYKQMEYGEAEAALLEKLPTKLYLINSSIPPTNIQGLEAHGKAGFEVKTVEASSHFPMIENPVEFNQALEEILDVLARE